MGEDQKGGDPLPSSRPPPDRATDAFPTNSGITQLLRWKMPIERESMPQMNGDSGNGGQRRVQAVRSAVGVVHHATVVASHEHRESLPMHRAGHPACGRLAVRNRCELDAPPPRHRIQPFLHPRGAKARPVAPHLGLSGAVRPGRGQTAAW